MDISNVLRRGRVLGYWSPDSPEAAAVFLEEVKQLPRIEYFCENPFSITLSNFNYPIVFISREYPGIMEIYRVNMYAFEEMARIVGGALARLNPSTLSYELNHVMTRVQQITNDPGRREYVLAKARHQGKSWEAREAIKAGYLKTSGLLFHDPHGHKRDLDATLEAANPYSSMRPFEAHLPLFDLPKTESMRMEFIDFGANPEVHKKKLFSRWFLLKRRE